MGIVDTIELVDRERRANIMAHWWAGGEVAAADYALERALMDARYRHTQVNELGRRYIELLRSAQFNAVMSAACVAIYGIGGSHDGRGDGDAAV